MAFCDYHACDLCGIRKAFYDADLNGRCDKLLALCEECSKTHKVEVVPLSSPAGSSTAAKYVSTDALQQVRWALEHFASNGLVGDIALAKGALAGIENLAVTLKLAREALSKIPIVRLSADGLTWDCPRCGARSGITGSGSGVSEACKPHCYVPLVERALAALGGAR